MYLTNLFIHRHASHTFCSDLKIISKQIFTHKHRQIVRQKLTFMRRRTTKKWASNIIANNRPDVVDTTPSPVPSRVIFKPQFVQIWWGQDPRMLDIHSADIKAKILVSIFTYEILNIDGVLHLFLTFALYCLSEWLLRLIHYIKLCT